MMQTPSRLRELPNVLSLSRVIFAAGFVAIDGTVVRASIIGIAGLTDILDGWLARRLRVATPRGALLDPVADRIFVVAATLTLVANQSFTVGQALVLLARDIATALGFVVALAVPSLRASRFKARVPGKVVTLLQFATLLVALAAPPVTGAVLALVAVASIWSIIDYTIALWHSRA